jgi:hypothetical protein
MRLSLALAFSLAFALSSRADVTPPKPSSAGAAKPAWVDRCAGALELARTSRPEPSFRNNRVNVSARDGGWEVSLSVCSEAPSLAAPSPPVTCLWLEAVDDPHLFEAEWGWSTPRLNDNSQYVLSRHKSHRRVIVTWPNATGYRDMGREVPAWQSVLDRCL